MKIFFLAHLFMISGGGQSLPVIGTPTSALIFALLFTATVLILYCLIDFIPKPRKNRITPKNEPAFAKAMIVIISGIIMSVCWDIWWHQALGRDSLFIPPHVFLYSLTMLAIGLSLYVWRHCRDILWKHITFALLMVIVSTAFDNYWHSIFGVENYASPVRLAWAPPHVLLALSVLAAMVLLQFVLIKYRKTPDFNFFSSLAFGGVTALALGMLMPFSPTEGWGAVAGFAGTVVWAFVFISMALLAQRVLRGRIDATFMTIFLLMFTLVTYGKEIAPNVIMLPHDRPPVWLFMFAFLFTAILLDITQDRFRLWVRGLFAGIVWAGILFGFSSAFFLPQFQYGLTETAMAIVFAALGGLVAGSLLSLFHLTDEKHIEKLLKKF